MSPAVGGKASWCNEVMSWQMKLAATYLRLTRRPGYATAASATARLAAPKGSSSPPRALFRRCRVSHSLVTGADVYILTPRTEHVVHPSVSLIYVHGGAYVGEIQKQHWDLVADLAEGTAARVCVPIYGLAPDHHVDEALELMGELMTRCAETGDTYLVGDSAGGGLAIAAVRSWIDAGGSAPLGLSLISPWLDIALSNPEIDVIERSDPWLTRVGLRICGQSWAGSVPLEDFRVSPIHAAFDGFPPIDLYVGDRDITVADCRRLRDLLPDTELRYHEEAGAVHVYPLLPVPEGRVARTQLVNYVDAILRQAGQGF
jgi:acetyl esterase/lipase